MSSGNSRHEILRRLKSNPGFAWDAPEHPPEPYHDMMPRPDDLMLAFKSELEAVGGEVYQCSGTPMIVEAISQLLIKLNSPPACCFDATISEVLSSHGINVKPELSCEVAITPCEYLIARSGSVMVTGFSETERAACISSNVHLLVAKGSQLRPFLRDAIESLKLQYPKLPPWVGIITGPSRSADIEKTLVIGVHGPERLIVFVDKDA